MSARRALDASASGSVQGRLLIITALALAPIVLFAVGVSLQRAYGAAGFLQGAAWIAASTLPLIGGLAAVLIVSFTAETLILRWLIYLERLARAYSKGRYGLRPKRLEHAPAEFQSLGVAVADMAAAVEERDAALRTALEEQKVLLREVHHRVKNNLQIVGSLLSLQASRSGEPAVRHALREALVRIDAMALSQRFMQPTEGEDQVQAPEIFNGFAVQAQARLRAGGRRLTIDLDIEEHVLGLDLAARLVLIAAEALLQAYRRPFLDPLVFRIGLAVEDQTAVLTAQAVGDPEAFANAGDTISADLINGYIRQVHGRLVPNAAGDRLIIRAPLAISRR